MNRLQKKCLIATAGFHLTLLLVLIFGSAFFSERSKPDDLQVLDVIPATAIDAAFTSGVKNAQPPAPTPIAKPIEQPTPVVKSEPQSVVKPVQPITPPEKITPDELAPVKIEKPEPHKIQVDLTVAKRTTPKNTAQTSPDDSQRKLAQQRARAAQTALRNLKYNLTTGTEINLPGNSSAAYANYASIVKSIYDAAWTPPDNTASDDANTKVSVTIARDGTVISARITEKSGDATVDATVQRTLDRITFIAPFPDDAKDKERTYIINFNLKSKRMLG
jgi:TonB family protein